MFCAAVPNAATEATPRATPTDAFLVTRPSLAPSMQDARASVRMVGWLDGLLFSKMNLTIYPSHHFDASIRYLGYDEFIKITNNNNTRYSIDSHSFVS